MPIYEYQCRECSHRFDKLTRMGTADSDIPCPSCGEHHAERQISVFAVGRGGATAAAPMTPCGKPAGSCSNPNGCSYEA